MQSSAGPEGERCGIWVIGQSAHEQASSVDIGFMAVRRPTASSRSASASCPSDAVRGLRVGGGGGARHWATLASQASTASSARCDSDNDASIGVLERAGFVRTAEADGVIHWRAAGNEDTQVTSARPSSDRGVGLQDHVEARGGRARP